LIPAFETGEKDDNICYARCGNKIGECKVSVIANFRPFEMDYMILAFSEYILVHCVHSDYIL